MSQDVLDDFILASLDLKEMATFIGGGLPPSKERDARGTYTGLPFFRLPVITAPDPIKNAVPDYIPVDPGLC